MLDPRTASERRDESSPPASPRYEPTPVTLRVTFDSEHQARAHWRELRERDYAADVVLRDEDEWFVVVTTEPWLRAEVVGLAWMRDGVASEIAPEDIVGVRLIG